MAGKIFDNFFIEKNDSLVLFLLFSFVLFVRVSIIIHENKNSHALS